MDKSTLSNYGWIVIAVLVLSVMIALATPFGQYIENGVRATTEGLFSTSQNAMNSAFGDLGVEVKDQTFEEGYTNTNGGSGTSTPTKDPALNPDDGTGVYDGMIYTSGNYEYRYNQYSFYASWSTDTTQNGWGVRCVNNVSDPGPILESINGKPITNLCTAFYYCQYIEVAPIIPSTVTNLRGTFEQCRYLKTYAGSADPQGDWSGYIIPSGVTTMQETFNYCYYAMTIAPDLSHLKNLTNMSNAFQYCLKLETAPVIPDGVIYMGGAFNTCQKLKSAPMIPESVQYLSGTFSYCSALTGEIELPCSLASENYQYSSCSATIKYYHIDGCNGSCDK